MADTVTTPKPILNYRIEAVMNGFVLHVTRGKEGETTKLVFVDKGALLKFLDSKL